MDVSETVVRFRDPAHDPDVSEHLDKLAEDSTTNDADKSAAVQV